MDDIKRELKLLLDLFKNRFGDENQTQSGIENAEFSSKDIEFIVKCIHSFKREFSHFSAEEEEFLMPLFTLSSHFISFELFSGRGKNFFS